MQRHSKQEGDGASLEYEEGYFSGRDYVGNESFVKRNVAEVIKWASRVSGENYSAGKGKRALDVGCAYGYAAQVLTGFGYDTCGVDVSRWGIQDAKANSGGNVLVCDAQTSLPFTAESFDLVTCFDVLEHLKFPEKALQNMLECCRGSLVCTTPNRRVEKPARRLMRDFDETHINVKSPVEWGKSLKSIAQEGLVKVETFLDLTAKKADKVLLFRSLKVPVLELTVRILVKK
jgi:2-polyprenyl-3-methyl-5-hydroxy-6-metoxy-1,4-benzoquinol methylase